MTPDPSAVLVKVAHAGAGLTHVMLADGWFTSIVFAPTPKAQLLVARHLALNLAQQAPFATPSIVH